VYTEKPSRSYGVGPPRMIPCGKRHVFHLECIREAFRSGNLCPMCRKEFKVIRTPSFADRQYHFFYDPLGADEVFVPCPHVVGGYLKFDLTEEFPPNKHWGWTREDEDVSLPSQKPITAMSSSGAKTDVSAHCTLRNTCFCSRLLSQTVDSSVSSN
jgi:hypothetical protein